MATFIPGYLSEVTVGSDSIEGNLGSGTLTLNTNVIEKPVAGSQKVTSIAGLKRATLSVSGHISTEDWGKFNTAAESNAAIAFIFQIGEAGGATDVGDYTGTMLIESLTPAFDADDEWSFSMDAKCLTWVFAAPA